MFTFIGLCMIFAGFSGGVHSSTGDQLAIGVGLAFILFIDD